MSTLEILNKVKYISDSMGRNREVILPHRLFQDLMELKASMEIYEQSGVQSAIKKSKKQLRAGNGKSFTNAAQAIRWLRR